MTDIKNASQRSNPERSSFKASERHERSLDKAKMKIDAEVYAVIND